MAAPPLKSPVTNSSLHISECQYSCLAQWSAQTDRSTCTHVEWGCVHSSGYCTSLVTSISQAQWFAFFEKPTKFIAQLLMGWIQFSIQIFINQSHWITWHGLGPAMDDVRSRPNTLTDCVFFFADTSVLASRWCCPRHNLLADGHEHYLATDSHQVAIANLACMGLAKSLSPTPTGNTKELCTLGTRLGWTTHHFGSVWNLST